jgi:outer membrane receptor protein involved in Fe transport
MGIRSPNRSADIVTVASTVLRALSVCVPAALLDTPAAIAQNFEPTRLATDIPAQPLAQALAAFARQTGLQLLYVSEVVSTQRSHAVSAGLGADEALTQLLQGTGLRFDYLTARSIRILAAQAARPVANSNVRADEKLPEVIVTANRREEDLQNVPITMQVLTGAKLAKLNATTFDDFALDLPGVTAHGVGPGQNDIYVRGLATTVWGIQASGYAGAFPSVAVYLDEQSAELPSRNLDVYAADLERIEVLEGPQGTLFGAGAQAGVIRYITNKPKLNVTEGLVNAGYATTAHGAPSSNLDATVNLPLVADELAVRAVIYNEQRGGYIQNLPATFARADTDLSIRYADAGGKVPADSVVINNSNVAGHDINPVTYKGLRVEALYRFDEDWSALLAQSYQNIEADGVFAEMAANSLGQPQPDLSVQLFNPSYDKDRFENTALTIDGRVGALKVVYAGAYLVRNITQVADYTSYDRGGTYVDYYQCANPGNTPATARCFTPSTTWRDLERNTHESHELRVSTPDNWRIRAVGGLFYENYRIQSQADWFYLTALPYFSPIEPATGYYAVNGHFTCLCESPGAVFVPGTVTSNNPNIRPLGDGFFNDITRGYNQQAAYASIDFELIPKKLTLTAGTRYFRTTTSEVGSFVGSFGCQRINNPMVSDPCVTKNNSDSVDLNAEGLHRTFSGFRSRADLSSQITKDALLYYTWSQGFRAGGFNRVAVQPLADSPLSQGSNPWQAQANRYGTWTAPLEFAPDTLTNNELGWKTIWLDHRIQWDGTIYQENWNHAQIGLSGIKFINLGVDINGGNYRVRGIETSVVARVTTGLSIEAAAAWNHSELVKQATLYWPNGTPIDFSALQNSNGGQFPNPGGALGSAPAGAPSFQGNIRARYEFAFNGYNAFGQIGAVYQSHSLATTDQLSLDPQGNSLAYHLPSFTTYDGAVGVAKDAWLVQFYAENLTDTRAELYANYWQFYKAIMVSRPRTIGLRLSYKFGGG